MVDDSGRRTSATSQSHRIRRTSISLTNRSWISVISVCISVSIIVQLGLPFAQKFIVDWWSRRTKTVEHKVVAANLRIEGEVKAAYLVEPFPVGRWNGNSAEVVRKVPIEYDDVANMAYESEALAALSVARKAREDGNEKKCKTIIEHALALCPNSPDVLTEYGIFLETMAEDVVSADSFYTRALSFNPHHSTALSSRERTRGVVAELDGATLADLRKMRDQFSDLPHSSLLRREMRESYFAHIYHTVAIEGNTLDLGQTRSVLETGMPIPGKSLVEHNEILGMDAALRFLNQTLIDNREITVQDILEIHRRVLGHVAPADAGRLRSTQVYVGRFTPVAPSEVAVQMEELVEWLNDERTLNMEPVERAAIAHYKLVLTHPFVDGNGRTARLLMNVVLMRSGFPPVILPVEDKAEYYATLHTANLGDLRPFVRFVARHTRRTLQKYLELASTCTTSECSTDAMDKKDSSTLRIPPA